ncbi:hypothetical protein H0H92_002939 [Tricholoma furcatifolium]|nr:hypothetical protein H0H92_002939 [Tricholoma furcatifolium]
MFAKSFTVLALSASALATVFVTSPTASSTFVGGQQATVSWQDDGNTPSLASFGPANVSIYVGNAQQQTQLQLIVTGVDVSTTSSIQFTPDATIGPDSNEYFIRFESLSLMDPANPQYPAEAFSAKYTMSGMSGTFSSAVQAEIAGQSTAPLAGATTAGATSAPATSATSASSTKASSASATKASASATTSANAAINMKSSSWFGIALGAIVGAAIF